MNGSDLKQYLMTLSNVYDWTTVFKIECSFLSPPITITKRRKNTTVFGSISPEIIFIDDSDDDTLLHSRDDVMDSLLSPSNHPSETQMKPETNRKSKKLRSLSLQLYEQYNKDVFMESLPDDMVVEWSNKLLTTAGRTFLKSDPSGSRGASIELSSKVVDGEERLQQTLLHEMCHAAAWIVDGVSKPPHGAVFKKWANIVHSKVKGVLVETCHSYDIHRPFKFGCSNPCCGKVYGRHTKKGVNLESQRCGECTSNLQFLGAFNADGTPKKIRAPTKFSLFMKENFAAVKAAYPQYSQKLLMEELSRRYKDKETLKENIDIDDDRYENANDMSDLLDRMHL